LDISARRSVLQLIHPRLPTITSFQDTEINADSADKSTSSDFYFYDFTAKLLFDLNDKHSFRANIIGINNALNYAEYSNADQSASKVSSFRKEHWSWKGNGRMPLVQIGNLFFQIQY
jgi:hypothetical protein